MRRSVCAELKVTQDKLSQFRRKPRKNSRKFKKIAKKFRKNVFAFFSKLCFSNAHPTLFAFNFIFSKFFFTIRQSMQRRRAFGARIFENFFFYVQKRSPTKFACKFWAFFERFLLEPIFWLIDRLFQKSENVMPCAFACYIEW